MTIQDQISDMITRIRNSVMVKHEKVSVGKSKLKLSILGLERCIFQVVDKL